MSKLLELGNKWLNSLTSLSEAMQIYKLDLQQLTAELSTEQDWFSWLSVIQALIASDQGTFGVGAIIVDSENEIVVAGGNQVFKPHFRSDLHAEMVVLDKLEDSRKSSQAPIDYALYTSLEPCMMCLGRIILSRISQVYFVTRDYYGGIIQTEHLPKTFANLQQQQVIKEINCHAKLKNLSNQIHEYSVQKLVYQLGGTLDVLQTH